MRKLIALMGILFLAVGMLAVNTVSAGNITIDNGVSNTGSGLGGADQVVVPGAVWGQEWDLEGFFRSGTEISIVGGFDFKGGQGGFAPGNLFIANQQAATYGVAPGGTGTTDGYKTISNTFGYNYVVLTDFTTDPLHPKWTLYQITPDTQLSSVYYRAFDWSDPLKLLSTTGTGVSLVGSGVLGYQSGLSDVTTGFLGGSHYELDYLGLGSLLPGYTTNSNYFAYFHYTYGCGNDFLVGRASGAEVPLPPSALLLGTGLLGLVGLGWRRRQSS